MAEDKPILCNNKYLKTTPEQKKKGLKEGIDRALKCDSSFILIIGGKNLKDGFEVQTTSSLSKNLSPQHILQIVANMISKSVTDTAREQQKRLGK